MKNICATVLGAFDIHRDPQRFSAWPSVCRTRDGELIVAFSGDRLCHVDPFGKNMLVRSRDNGRTWSRPAVVNDTPLDDRDAGIIQTRTGTLLLFFFTSDGFVGWQEEAKQYYGERIVRSWRPAIDRVTTEVRRQFLGSFCRRSVDNGRSWSDLIPTGASAPHGAIELVDGTLAYAGNGDWQGEHAVVLTVSTDDGRSWTPRSLIAPMDLYDNVRFYEPHLAELPDGRLLVHLRANAANPDDRFLYQAESEDQGHTWSRPEKTTVWGLPPHLLLHSSGILVTVYGHRRKPYGQRASFSRDSGRTWGDECVLAAADHPLWDKPEDVRSSTAHRHDFFYQVPDLGYPCSVELENGEILTVFYETLRPDTPAAIRGVRWRLHYASRP